MNSKLNFQQSEPAPSNYVKYVVQAFSFIVTDYVDIVEWLDVDLARESLAARREISPEHEFRLVKRTVINEVLT